ncbi:acyl-CoA dehydrogenase family protein [Gulosibacter sp. 10]|uniref:acyl-CoA dehydrogenase family protein n=1 Tax=Gulosibacter sp. 10 TaxID=1255570 RepID=UPI00097EE89A|nr:acyl-CoA dehydrogenase family protein [Gulosibacter sp. 10]SJM70073.1 Butyryl-CoA dehydrogenase [Gulosibacter sp. 10]
MSVSFALSPEQQQLKSDVRAFARGVLAPLMEQVRAERDPQIRAGLMRPAVEAAVEAGMLRALIPAPFGGAATNGVDAALFIEEIAVESPDFFITMAGPLIALAPVYEVGTPEQIERFVSPFLASEGAPVAAMAFSEPDGSANFGAEAPADGVLTTAVPDGDEWVVNGRKAWSSLLPGWDGDGPDIMTIVCRTPGGVSLVVAEREQLAGRIEVEEYYDLPGLTGCMTARVRLHDVRVPKSHLIGEEGDGVRLTLNAFMASGASIGTFATAAARRAWEVAYEFATTQKRGGAVPIIEYQSVSDVLADTKGRIEAMRLLGWRSLDAVIAQDPAGGELALHSKVFGSESGLAVVNDLIKVVGVTAYDSNFPLVRHLNDALAYPIIEGSNTGVRRRQLQAMLAAEGFDPLAASGLS